ncbi:hypothetical protein CFOL_v3_04498 [Cephalotus follicularis]|uniref:Uncharacterized protein n=1 Tax=Cephalotus follicularis TaxID=3775 RepID=A0A1Q3AZ21_CEPFO|nr:hypothetical protein CFOL_v3_04498 [Cephalotus follicularis]
MAATYQPTHIEGYPAGPIQLLFKKDLTNSDVKSGLKFVGKSKSYLEGLGDDMIRMLENGLLINLHTPALLAIVELKRRFSYGNYVEYKLNLPGWKECVQSNGFFCGQSVCCWAIYTEQTGLCFLLEEAPRLTYQM